MSNEFNGLNVIVTGAGSGIGLAVARKLKSEGATVFGFDIDKGSMGDAAAYIECDVGDTSSVAAAVAKVSAEVSTIDILANNAGVGAVGSVLDATDDEWARLFNINVAGIARVSAAVHPLLLKSKNPCLLYTSDAADE